MIPVDFRAIQGPENSKNSNFELLVARLLKRKTTNATHIHGAGGDGGVDVLVQLAGEARVDVYQVKYFCEPLTKSQKKQIEHSLEQAAAGEQLRRWTLVVPIDPTRRTKKWFDERLQGQFPNIQIEWLGKIELQEMLSITENLDLREDFFSSSVEVQGVVVPFLPATVPAPPSTDPRLIDAPLPSVLEEIRFSSSGSAVILDNATVRFALRSLHLQQSGSRFDDVHIACLQQLVEAIVMYDAVIVPELERSGWEDDRITEQLAGAVHFVKIPPAWDEMLEADALLWFRDWINSPSARGLVGRLLHIQKRVWERKGLTLHEGVKPIEGMGRMASPMETIWDEFVAESAMIHRSVPGEVYVGDEWREWLDRVHGHGVSLLYWMLYRPFWYHLLSNWIWGLPYFAHPSRGMALAFESFHRDRRLSDVALSTVANLHKDYTEWVNTQTGQQLFSTTLPPVFRWVLNKARRPDEILSTAMILRSSDEAKQFRVWTRKIEAEGTRNPNAMYQACIGLAKFAQQVRDQWGISSQCSDILWALPSSQRLPDGTSIGRLGSRHYRVGMLFLKRLADSIQSVTELSALYDKHFWDARFDWRRFDESLMVSQYLERERPKSRRVRGRERLTAEAQRQAEFEEMFRGAHARRRGHRDHEVWYEDRVASVCDVHCS